ncbi:MAG: cell wall-active antibiotics response protein LiaF [Chloroflexota bacterium]|nr:cell wall-active antibiotics response protein LiaF [Chloroflexota bacterium]
MQNKQQVFIGTLIILIGVMLLIGSIFDIDVGDLCFPLGLIAVGVWLLFRPQLVAPDTVSQLRLLGDVHRYGAWQVTDEEIWIGVGDVELDMTDADVPVGETRLRVLGFVCDVDLLVPEDVGVSVLSTALVTDARVLGQRRDSFFIPFHLDSDDYETAERKVRLETTFFVGSLKVRQV